MSGIHIEIFIHMNFQKAGTQTLEVIQMNL